MLPAPVTAPAVVTPVAEATGLASWAWLLIAVPAVSAALLLLAGRRSNAWGHWLGLAQRSGQIVSRQDSVGGVGATGSQDTGRSGMPAMPGAAAPAVKQPVLSDDDAADSAAPEQKEEK